ncbi:MAG: hypothetical protein Q9162_005204 [Coniocarpon cinnabarinum]
MAASSELDQLLQAVQRLGDFKFSNASDKRKAMLATRAVSDKLQHPYDKILEMWGGVSKDAALKVCVDVDLFAKWQNAGAKQTALELSELTGVQYQLLGARPKMIGITEFSRQLSQPEVAACVGLQFDAFLPSFTTLPAYLRSTGYRRPTDAAFAPLSYAMNFPGTFFEYMQQNTRCGQSLDLTMKGYAAFRGNWLDVYPAENLIQAGDPQGLLVVDVGGGLGHDMEKLRAKFPTGTKDRLILQDQPSVISKINSLDGVKVMSHDFFTEQPIKGARAYYLHQILHDWPEEQCRAILANLKPALAPDKSSRILINEMVVPSTGASLNNTAYDLIMMSMFSASERGEKTWRDLITSVGLRVNKIWTSPLAIESVIEVALED